MTLYSAVNLQLIAALPAHAAPIQFLKRPKEAPTSCRPVSRSFFTSSTLNSTDLPSKFQPLPSPTGRPSPSTSPSPSIVPVLVLVLLLHLLHPSLPPLWHPTSGSKQHGLQPVGRFLFFSKLSAEPLQVGISDRKMRPATRRTRRT